MKSSDIRVIKWQSKYSKWSFLPSILGYKNSLPVLEKGVSLMEFPVKPHIPSLSQLPLYFELSKTKEQWLVHIFSPSLPSILSSLLWVQRVKASLRIYLLSELPLTGQMVIECSRQMGISLVWLSSMMTWGTKKPLFTRGPPALPPKEHSITLTFHRVHRFLKSK